MDALRLDALPPAAATLALVEVLDREGHDAADAPVRQAHAVTAWPLRIGRALDNDLVLADPHVAPHHAVIDADAGGLRLVAGDTRNGVQLGAALGGRRLAAGAHCGLPASGPAIELTLGRTPLRLRLPGHDLPAERPLEAAPPRRRHALQIAGAAFAVLAMTQFIAWLDSDPDVWPRAAAASAASMVALFVGWSGLWALLSKTFTRRSRYGWHLRVALFAGCAVMVTDVLPSVLGFMFSWPVVSDFGFVANYAVFAAAFYFHLLAVEPARPRLMRGVALAGFATALALTLWQNLQRTDRLGDELYLAHLFPPALRLAKPVSTDEFMKGAEALRPMLDRHAKEPGRGEAGPAEGE